MVREYINSKVHHQYYEYDTNCARTTLICLADLFDIKIEEKTILFCKEFAAAFEQRFSSLRCLELRPDGFAQNDPPHLCERLTCEAIEFTYEYIKEKSDIRICSW